VAIQIEIQDDGDLVSGTYPYPGGAQIPQIFNPAAYPTNDSLKMIIGVVNLKESIVRLTTDLHVLEVYSLPYELEPGLTINHIDKNGTIELSYENESINIPTGSTWKSPVISVWNETNTVKFPPPNLITGEDHGTNYTYTLQFTRTWNIENKGIYDKQ
jgi:hypothetical protein